MKINRFFILLLTGQAISGCGIHVPEKHEFYEGQPNAKALENVILNNVKCELKNGLMNVGNIFQQQGRYPGNDVRWLDKLGATINLKITVDEKSALSPGLTLTRPFQNGVARFATGNVTSSQSFSLGLGASASTNATRTESISFTYSFADLKKENAIARPPERCADENGVFIESDLKIGQFLEDKMFLAAVPGTVVTEEDKKSKGEGSKKEVSSPFSVFSYQVKFVVTYSGNVTPTWKFLRVTANPASPFLNSTRTKTNDLTITIGKTKPATPASPAVLVSSEAQAVHLANLIGQSVASAIQTQEKP